LKHVDSPQNIPPWEETWNKICDLITNDVLEFNLDRGPQFMVSKLSPTGMNKRKRTKAHIQYLLLKARNPFADIR
jgi:hypothetical protein